MIRASVSPARPKTFACTLAAAALPLAATAIAHPAGDPRPLPSAAVAAGATVSREAGIEFVTIPVAGRTTGAANPAWPGNGRPDDRAIGRGSVGYEYRIGRYEVTTAQWVEFMNAALDRRQGDLLTHIAPPAIWGASSITPVNPGGQRYAFSPSTAMFGVGGITWRQAAMYCNWLHNGKGTDRAVFLSGAYDVSTFTTDILDTPQDQLTRSPGAKFFIPTMDEWIKAAHYDPARLDTPITSPTSGGAGYWLYSHGSDISPSGAPPGVNAIPGWGSGPGQVNAGWSSQQYPGFSPFSVPLGAYTSVMSPWGLFDTGGGTTEWTEEFEVRVRYSLGGAWLSGGAEGLGAYVSLSPSQISLTRGFRIAAAVPASGTVVFAVPALALLIRRRR